jgi:hypothetical protein
VIMHGMCVSCGDAHQKSCPARSNSDGPRPSPAGGEMIIKTCEACGNYEDVCDCSVGKIIRERDALKAELEAYKTKGVCGCPRCGAYLKILAERDALKAENEKATKVRDEALEEAAQELDMKTDGGKADQLLLKMAERIRSLKTERGE